MAPNEPRASSSREESKLRAQVLPMTLNKPLGYPELRSAALPIPNDCSRPWDLSSGKQGCILVIKLHWPPKCSVHFLNTQKFHIANQWLSCPDPENLTQIN